mgnify:CR=1 FL=1
MLRQEKGILLLALGHGYYGRMAYNLAMSIKAIDPNAHITLVYTESAISHINQRNMWVFDNKLQIDDQSYPFGAKLLLNKLTPYERTLYIDVDTLWVNKYGPSKLLEQLKGVSFTGITEGFHDYKNPEKSDPSKYYFFWADLDEIKKVHNLGGKIYQWRSEFIYFENCTEANELFRIAREIYGNHGLKTVKMFGDHIPDELAFNISAAIVDTHPHQYKWQPSYWDRLYGGHMPGIEELQYKYYVISCGSNASFGALKRVYDRLCAASAYKLKLQHVFPLISKKEMLTNRQLM